MKEAYEEEKKTIRAADQMIDELEFLYQQMMQNSSKESAGLTEKILNIKGINKVLKSELKKRCTEFE